MTDGMEVPTCWSCGEVYWWDSPGCTTPKPPVSEMVLCVHCAALAILDTPTTVREMTGQEFLLAMRRPGVSKALRQVYQHIAQCSGS